MRNESKLYLEGSQLRRQYINYLVLKGRSPKTIRVYVKWVKDLANHYKQSPATLEDHEITAFILHLHYNGKAKSTINQAVNAIRGFYKNILNWPADKLTFVVPRTSSPKKVPRAYSVSQIKRLFEAAETDPFQYTFLSCQYHTGVRLNEGCSLVFSDIERESSRVLVRGGKGDKDRYTLLPYMLEEQLDRYYHDYRRRLGSDPAYLFLGKRSNGRPLPDGSAQEMFYRARRKANLPDIGGIHTLRHSFASHQLMAGMSLERLRAVLGHRNITTTIRYLHLVGGGAIHYNERLSPLESLNPK